MAKPKSPIVMTHDLSIMPPEKESAYLISISDWTFLKKKVTCIDSDPFLFQTLGSLLLGVAGSAFLTLKTIPNTPSNDNAIVVWWAGTIVAAIAGALLLWVAHRERLQAKGSKDSVIEEMNRLESRYTRTD